MDQGRLPLSAEGGGHVNYGTTAETSRHKERFSDHLSLDQFEVEQKTSRDRSSAANTTDYDTGRKCVRWNYFCDLEISTFT